MTLSACMQAPRSPEPSTQQCAPVTACTLPAMAPRSNGELGDALDVARAAWRDCAARVDMILVCQAKGLPALTKAPDHE
ncbi:Rz1-like lysis system protein LysC [Paraburkholderia aspalathi]|uniref:Rz1-like lysis system protein LysC n=1 Tax=Paraburkholderia aspalathi TaxID=1324617 RepID=UPI001FD41BE2|nr:Rz1-like lysis system protein LysC [Paraburkholderia aspalathi]